MTKEEISTTLKQISDLLYLLRCNMTSISRYVSLNEDNPNKEKYKKLAKVSVDNILDAINNDLNKDYAEFVDELLKQFEKEKKETAEEILSWIKEKIQRLQFNYIIALGTCEQIIDYKAKDYGLDADDDVEVDE